MRGLKHTNLFCMKFTLGRGFKPQQMLLFPSLRKCFCQRRLTRVFLLAPNLHFKKPESENARICFVFNERECISRKN